MKGGYKIEVDKTRGVGAGFSGELIVYLTADSCWWGGQSASDEVCRPVYTAFLAAQSEAAAMVANFQSGRGAKISNRHGSERHRLNWPRSATFRWRQQQVGDGTVVVEAYFPELFDLDPGTAPERVRFLHLAPPWWADSAGVDAVATLFALRLDRRTTAPILSSPEFHHWMLTEARRTAGTKATSWIHVPEGMRSRRGELFAFPEATHDPQRPLVDAKVGPALLIDGSHEEVESWVQLMTRRFIRERRVEPVARVAMEPRQLPPPVEPPEIVSAPPAIVSPPPVLVLPPPPVVDLVEALPATCPVLVPLLTGDRDGSTREQSSSRVLPVPSLPALQLSLFDLR